jgi:tetratricopeptide (TPR) repeat protein
MGELKFEITLKPAGQGLLWALWTLSEQKATGVLTIEWERFRKQMIFRRGEPIATKSNWLQESFGHFLARNKKLDLAKVQAEVKAKEEAGAQEPLGEWLMRRGLLESSEVFELLSKHFQERLFNLLALSHGNVGFATVAENKLESFESVKLNEPFRKVLWESTKQLYTDAVCKGKLSAYLARKGRVKGEFPFPIPPQELRLWNQLKTDQAVSSLQGLNLQFFAAATEFDLVEWAQSESEKILTDLKTLAEKFNHLKLHEILGVELESPPEVCKKTYLELVKKYHPDRLPMDHTAEAKKLSEEVFAKINEAYSVMTDSKKKEEYKASLALEEAGGAGQLKESIEAELLIPQAKMALRRRHFTQAIEMYRQIQKSLPQDGEVLADLTFCELMVAVESKVDVKSKIPSWKESLKKAMQMNSNNADALYYRGVISKMEGQMDKALSDFDHAIQMNPRLTEAVSEARLLRMRKDKKGSGFFGKNS